MGNERRSSDELARHGRLEGNGEWLKEMVERRPGRVLRSSPAQFERYFAHPLSEKASPFDPLSADGGRSASNASVRGLIFTVRPRKWAAK